MRRYFALFIRNHSRRQFYAESPAPLRASNELQPLNRVNFGRQYSSVKSKGCLFCFKSSDHFLMLIIPRLLPVDRYCLPNLLFVAPRYY
jgi:hypothetical protein